jgi:hypothetical protein
MRDGQPRAIANRDVRGKIGKNRGGEVTRGVGHMSGGTCVQEPLVGAWWRGGVGLLKRRQ